MAAHTGGAWGWPGFEHSLDLGPKGASCPITVALLAGLVLANGSWVTAVRQFRVWASQCHLPYCVPSCAQGGHSGQPGVPGGGAGGAEPPTEAAGQLSPGRREPRPPQAPTEDADR